MQAIKPPSDAPKPSAALKQRIAERTAKIGVVGAGYIGLPLAVTQAKAGFTVIAVDQNPIRVAQLNQGSNYLRDVDDSDLAAVVARGKLSATTELDRIGECDVVIMCVPTPVTLHKDPDTSFIRKIAAEIAARLRPGRLIVLESTSYPGVTEELLLPILSGSGLELGHDFFLAFSPERVDPGNARYVTVDTNKVVGGVTPACLEVASHFYRQTFTEIVPVSSPRVAELSKIFENTFRAVNIALVNEMAQLCDKLGVDVWEVIDAANTKPFGMMRFEPGPGVGGHCIPLDPFYLTWKARRYDFHMRFTETAAEINLAMPLFVREKIRRALNDRGVTVNGARILQIGIAYKRNVDDWQESPALKVLHLLEQDGATVDYHDPHIPSMREEDGLLRHSVLLTEGAIAGADCVVIATDHADVDFAKVVRHARLVVDARNATRRLRGDFENVVVL